MRVRVRSITTAAVAAVVSALIVSSGTPANAARDDDAALSAISVSRIAGTDRYDGAVQIAQATRTRADVVYLASGADFPDALSAGPAVVRERGALLLVPASGLTAGIAIELASLAPKRVVVVGGELSVPESILGQVRVIFGGGFPVTRISGADRYEVSRRLAASVFSTGSASVIAATGAKFPDALSAGPVATRYNAPLVLVNGLAPTADADTLTLFRNLRTSAIGIAGGPFSVTPGIESALGSLGSVHRYSGVDRYEVSAVLNEGDLWDFDTVYFATGANFPDALVGGVLAGTMGHPLYVVPGDCVPGRVLDRLIAARTHNVVLLGGLASLSSAVEGLTRC
ncbi:MAG: cell wall-binding repeat-containing protein [Herbiconiux sp.]|nr:cell wall-binding repeat-containing protein [Herbiconiux sp.]